MKNNILWILIITLLIQVINPLNYVVQATTLHKNNNEEELLIYSKEINDFMENEITLQNIKTVEKKSLSIKEDIDTNGIVDILDLSLISTKYNINKEEKEYDESLDLNDDGIIDIFDLINISKKIGSEPFLLVGTYEEDNSLIKYNGNWNEKSDINFSNNSIKLSSNVEDSIEFKFYGTGIEWYSLCSTSAGEANIYIDGNKIKTKDSYLWADYYNRLEFYKNDLDLSIHTVKIEIAGTKNALSTGTNVSVDRIIINNSMVGNIEKNYTMYQQTNNEKLYVGQYPTLDDVIYHGNLYANMYAIDSEGNEVWTNSHKVYQEIISGNIIFVGRYTDFSTARTAANNYKNSYIIDPYGKEIWRGRYELWAGSRFLNRYTTLEEAIAYGKKNDNTIIKDISDNNKIIWENKYSVYQVVERSQTSFLVGEYKTCEEAMSKAKQYANTYIINGNNEEIWTNSYTAFQDAETKLYELGRYDTFENAKNKAWGYKNSYVVDGSFKEIWRARYEVYQAKDNWSTFLGRHNTLNEAIKQANEYSFTKIIDVVDGDDLVWSQGERIRLGHIFTDGSNVNVRKNNDKNSEIIGSLTYATKVEVVESWMDDWYKIKYGNTIGYVEKQYISLNPPKDLPVIKTAYVNTGGTTLRIRQSTSLSSDIIGSLYDTDTVKIVSKVNNEWYRIKYNNGYGYVLAKYISDTIPVTGTKYVSTEKLNVRTGPGTNYSSIGILSYGTSVSIITKVDKWYKIKYNGGEAYVCGDYISDNKPVSGGTINIPSTVPAPTQSKIDKAIAAGKLKYTKIDYIYKNTTYKVYFDARYDNDFYRLSKVIFIKGNNVVETDTEILNKLMFLHYVNYNDYELKRSVDMYKNAVNNYISAQGSLIIANVAVNGIKAILTKNPAFIMGVFKEIAKDKFSIDTILIARSLLNINSTVGELETLLKNKKGLIKNYSTISNIGNKYEKYLNNLEGSFDIIREELNEYDTWGKVFKHLLDPSSDWFEKVQLKKLENIMVKVADGIMEISDGIDEVNTIVDEFILGRQRISLDVQYIKRNIGYTVDLIKYYK